MAKKYKVYSSPRPKKSKSGLAGLKVGAKKKMETYTRPRPKS